METSAVNRGFACLHSTIMHSKPYLGEEIGRGKSGRGKSGFYRELYIFFSESSKRSRTFQTVFPRRINMNRSVNPFLLLMSGEYPYLKLVVKRNNLVEDALTHLEMVEISFSLHCFSLSS